MNGYNEFDAQRREAQAELNSHVSYICLRLQMQQAPDEEDWKELLRLERRFRKL